MERESSQHTQETGRAQDEETGQAQQVAEQGREKAGQAATQARETAQDLAGQAQDRIRAQVNERSTQAGERVATTARDIRSVGEELRNQGKEGPANIAEQTADRVDRAGSYLRDSDADRILGDVEDFGRSRPWAVLAGAAVAGFAAARFLKASSRQRYSSREIGAAAGRTGPDRGRELAAGSTVADPSSALEQSEADRAPAGVR